QQNEKTFSQEEVSQLIKERIARERKKSDERIKDAVQEAEKLAKMTILHIMQRYHLNRVKNNSAF
uniref:capsid assembly scaffolding protein Gp46 family protein n=1 Tax=Staphylococcus aureus TaxID=1280 RepID=UPI00351EFC4A